VAPVGSRGLELFPAIRGITGNNDNPAPIRGRGLDIFPIRFACGKNFKTVPGSLGTWGGLVLNLRITSTLRRS
jgi:hypothetical protein